MPEIPIVTDWVRCTKGRLRGQILYLVKIDNAQYCTLAAPGGEIVTFHEPLQNLETDLAITVAGVAAEAKANEENSK